MSLRFGGFLFFSSVKIQMLHTVQQRGGRNGGTVELIPVSSRKGFNTSVRYITRTLDILDSLGPKRMQRTSLTA